MPPKFLKQPISIMYLTEKIKYISGIYHHRVRLHFHLHDINVYVGKIYIISILSGFNKSITCHTSYFLFIF